MRMRIYIKKHKGRSQKFARAGMINNYYSLLGLIYWIPTSRNFHREQQLDLFYLRPKKSPSDGLWHDNVPIGRDKLKLFLEVMCHDAGIIEKKTNNSLRDTGATALFNAGVPEKLIRDVTGHCSHALQLYERPSMQQRQEVSKVLVQGAQETHE